MVEKSAEETHLNSRHVVESSDKVLFRNGWGKSRSCALDALLASITGGGVAYDKERHLFVDEKGEPISRAKIAGSPSCDEKIPPLLLEIRSGVLKYIVCMDDSPEDAGMVVGGGSGRY